MRGLLGLARIFLFALLEGNIFLPVSGVHVEGHVGLVGEDSLEFVVVLVVDEDSVEGFLGSEGSSTVSGGGTAAGEEGAGEEGLVVGEGLLELVLGDVVSDASQENCVVVLSPGTHDNIILSDFASLEGGENLIGSFCGGEDD